jgi:hypothetical protein
MNKKCNLVKLLEYEEHKMQVMKNKEAGC